MRPEELQIGDWVLWKNKPVQIAEISGIKYSFGHIDVVLAHCNDDNLLESHDIKSIEPIPINPEFLVKNGFRLGNDGWLWFPDEGNEEQDYIFIQFRKGCNEIRKCELCFFKKAQIVFRTIQYIHQLQQAMRLCGINKEITLN